MENNVQYIDSSDCLKPRSLDASNFELITLVVIRNE